MSDEVTDAKPSGEPGEEKVNELTEQPKDELCDKGEVTTCQEKMENENKSIEDKAPKTKSEGKNIIESNKTRSPVKKSVIALSKEDIRAKLAGKTLKGTAKPKKQVSAAENMAMRIQAQKKNGNSLPPATRVPIAETTIEFEKQTETTDATIHRARPKGRRPPTRPKK